MTAPTTPSTRNRLLRAVLDSADITATITTGATCGLITYRTLATRRPPELRITLALAAGALTAALADQHTYTLLTPLRRRLGIEHVPVTMTATVPSLDTLGKDALTDAAHRAALHSWNLDRGVGTLSKAQNWQGAPDGTATCRLSPQAVLRFQPSHKDLGTPASRGWEERYQLLAADDAVDIVSVTQLHQLLERLAEGRPLRDTDDPDLTPEAESNDTTDPIERPDLDDQGGHLEPEAELEYSESADEEPF